MRVIKRMSKDLKKAEKTVKKSLFKTQIKKITLRKVIILVQFITIGIMESQLTFT